jgi:peroxiredoxin
MATSSNPPKSGSLAAQLVFWFTLAMVVLGIIWVRQGPRASQGGKHSAVGRPVPDFRLIGLTGGASDVSLQDLQGKVVLINFWGVWCGYCRVELPHLAALRQDLQSRDNFRLLAVTCEGGSEKLAHLREQTQQYLASQNLNLPTYADPDGSARQAVGMALGELDIPGYPTTVLIDGHGILRGVWVGYEPGTEIDMRREIEAQLK